MRIIGLLTTIVLVVGSGVCRDEDDRSLVINGQAVSEATLVASYRELAISTVGPALCGLLVGLDGNEAFEQFLRVLNENLGATPRPVPTSPDAGRAGDLLLEECEKHQPQGE